MSRLQLEMHVNDALFAMSEGNPGAIRVMMDAFEECPKVDPENTMGGWAFMLNLDTCEVYGHRIWGLFKRVCSEDLAKSIALVRSVQMGVISREQLDGAIDETSSLDVDETIRRLKERLPSLQT